MSKVGDVVTSVGSSWIICRSKTHGGRIYYFNTLTGEAAWNLSEAEVEKAKTQTKIYESRSDFKIDNCPEPLGSPQECVNKDIPFKIVTPKVYNKQIINNQFSKAQTPYSIQFPHCNSINPVQLSLPISSAFAPSIWNVIPQHIIVTPATTQPQLSPNNNFLPFNNTSEKLTNQFSNSLVTNNNKSAPIRKKKFIRKYKKNRNNYKQQLYGTKNNSMIIQKDSDLRFFLSSKGRIARNDLNQYQENNRKEYKVLPKVDQIPTLSGDSNKNTAIRNSYLDVADEVDNLYEDNSELQTDTHLLHIEHLRRFLQLNDNLEVWYLVTDSNVLLHHINLLELILKLDTKCRLFVPQGVMDQIQNATNSRLRTEAHKAAYFVYQQVDAKAAVIDEAIGENDSEKYEIMFCCIKLIKLGEPVILLTDDIELHNHENSSYLPIFTIMEIKRFLNNEKKEISNTTSNSQTIDHSQNITITINNESSTQLNQVTNTQITSDPLYDKDVEYCIGQQTDTQNLIDTNIDAEHDKETVDVGVQVKPCDVTLSKMYDNQNNSIIDGNENSHYISSPKKQKAIKLKRHKSHNSPRTNKLDKRKLNWHRHKTKFNLPEVDSHHETKHNDSSAIANGVDSIRKDSVPCDDENLDRGLSSHASTELLHKSGIHCNIEKQTSGTIFKNMNPGDNFSIEETSTSDMSNTFSNVETESTRSQKSTCFDLPLQEYDDKNVMFEVSSYVMEYHLRMKCDEWVSCFVQIMERALNRVLQDDPSFVLDSMPPPWTMHESIECVKIKFQNDSDVVDAATKLSRVSFENGGLRGKIKSTISPNKYMEMYSFGVYLIDALQGILANSEHLQSAAESLSKLLNKIQNPHLNTNIQNEIIDAKNRIDNEYEGKKVSYCGLESATKNNKEFNDKSPKMTKIKGPTISTGLYNLRSLQRKEESPCKVTGTGKENTKSRFFKSINLIQKLATHDPLEIEKTLTIYDPVLMEKSVSMEKKMPRNDPIEIENSVSIRSLSDKCREEHNEEIYNENNMNTPQNITSDRVSLNKTLTRSDPVSIEKSLSVEKKSNPNDQIGNEKSVFKGPLTDKCREEDTQQISNENNMNKIHNLTSERVSMKRTLTRNDSLPNEKWSQNGPIETEKLVFIRPLIDNCREEDIEQISNKNNLNIKKNVTSERVSRKKTLTSPDSVQVEKSGSVENRIRRNDPFEIDKSVSIRPSTNKCREEDTEQISNENNLNITSEIVSMKKTLNRSDPVQIEKSFSVEKIMRKNDSVEIEKSVSIRPSTNKCREEDTEKMINGKMYDTMDNIVNDNEKQSKCEPKIVRNFTKCFEFEERFQRRNLRSMPTYDSWTSRNEIFTDYCCEEGDFENQYSLDNYYAFNQIGSAGCDGQEYIGDSDRFGDGQFVEKIDDGIRNNNITFESAMEKLETSIRNTFLMVQNFCLTSHNNLSSQEKSTMNKNEIQKLSEKMYISVNSICDVLNSVLARESSDSTNKLCKLLDSKEFENIQVNEKDLENYIYFIDKCLAQGNNLKETLTLVIQASKEE